MKTVKISLNRILLLSCAVILIQGLSGCVNSGEKTSEFNRSPIKKEVQAPVLDIHAAALMGDIEAIRQHIAAGTDLEQKDPIGGSTPLITACVFGRTEVANALIEAGANLNARNNDGSTPLHCAALFCYTDIVKSLLEHGADKTIKNNQGQTPAFAVEGSFEDMIPAYDFFSRQLGPLGLKLDYDELKEKRPQIAALLK